MFLNSSLHLGLLEEMKAHALDMAEAIQRNDFKSFGTLVGKTWMQKKALDSGTNPPAVEDIIRQIKDYTLGYKLPGAGGGGYLYMVAKDPQAALRIRETLTLNVPNPRARFVEMSLSDKGFQVSRSWNSSFMMIRPPVQYGHRPVELLHKDEAHHLMGKGHA